MAVYRALLDLYLGGTRSMTEYIAGLYRAKTLYVEIGGVSGGEERALVGGARLVSTVTRGTSLSGTRTGTTLRTALRNMANTLGSNRRMRLVNFNAFGMGRHTTHANHGPGANSRVRVGTTGMPTFITNGTLGRSMGWSVLYQIGPWLNVFVGHVLSALLLSLFLFNYSSGPSSRRHVGSIALANNRVRNSTADFC